MNRLLRFAPWISLVFVAAFCAGAFYLTQSKTITAVNAATAMAQDQQAPPQDQQAPPPDQGQDPASVNMAPSGPSYTTQAPPPPTDQSGAAPGPDDQNYAEQPTETADQPPPPLPDYQQPPPPDDGYLWTPGYWAWGPAGYYWVPGAWVEPPYMGALWTPGYWGFYGGRYLFYPGYWGLHIGFYGGINYGFGYVGLGYEGGYWHSGHFFYNSVYNHINPGVVHNVYSFHANVRANNYSGANGPRASYRGGPGGVQARPQPSEGAAWHEPTAPRMSSQVKHAQTYQSNRGQIAASNHGQPSTPAISKPLPADHNVKPTVRASSGSQGHGGGERH
jgi:hypothetical protein